MPLHDRILKIRIDQRLIDRIQTHATEQEIDVSKATRSLLRRGLDEAGLAETVQTALAKELPAAVDAAVDRRMKALRHTVTVSAALAAAQGAGSTPAEAQQIAKTLSDALKKDEG